MFFCSVLLCDDMFDFLSSKAKHLSEHFNWSVALAAARFVQIQHGLICQSLSGETLSILEWTRPSHEGESDRTVAHDSLNVKWNLMKAF